MFLLLLYDTLDLPGLHMKNCLYLNTQMGNKITFEIVYFAPTLAPPLFLFFLFFLVLLILYIFLVLLIKSPHSVHINWQYIIYSYSIDYNYV